MIIACPECTSPFQVLDDQIAALLQIECPTCSFRMILDFAAANDAALREAGMQYAQGFRDEATYRQAVGAESFAPDHGFAAKPELRAAPPIEPEPQPELEPEREPEPMGRSSFTPAPTPQAVQPVQPVQPEPARAKPPVRARPTLIAHTAPPPVRQPTELIPTPAQTGPAVEPQTEASIDTHVGRPPQHEVAAPIEVPRPADEAQLEVPADEFSVDLDEPEPEPEPQPRTPRPRPVEQAEPRTPPHSPAPSSTTKPKPDEPDVTESSERPDHAEPPEVEPETGKKGGALRTAFLMLLLLLSVGAAGLMGWSVIETKDPNPLPMLKEKFGLDLGFGVPAEAPAQPEADDAADDKAGADKPGGQ